MPQSNAQVAILMGSDSDWPKISAVGEALDEFQVSWEAHVMSAHRTPDRVAEFARGAASRGIRVIIAAAGGAAHLAGVIAAHTTLPVVGIPVPTPDLGGLDSLLSTVQMPSGVPVVSVAVGMGGPRNAGLFAVQVLATSDPGLAERLAGYKQSLADQVASKDQAFQTKLQQPSA